jgi:biopolymer transport protein ExbB/TolQ
VTWAVIGLSVLGFGFAASLAGALLRLSGVKSELAKALRERDASEGDRARLELVIEEMVSNHAEDERGDAEALAEVRAALRRANAEILRRRVRGAARERLRMLSADASGAPTDSD